MIVMKIYGGLGNQMFQYALGLRLAQDRKVPLALDTSFFHPGYLHAYRLDALRIEAKVLTPRELARLMPLTARLPLRIARLLRSLPLRSKVNCVTEKHFHFDSSVLDVVPAAYIDGYWQSEKYFAPVADLLRTHFRLAEPMTPPRREKAGIIAGKNAVSVHVRRGDYVTNPEANAFHGTCTPAWYERAMAAMAAKVPDPYFFIFSDDPAWARAHLPSAWPCDFVEPQTDRRDFEDMQLMALCRHHIIANSSFSWWGAWLNPSPGKCVMAPARWFAGAPHDTRDLIPATWTRVE